jgi:hypothetical protein
MCEPCDKDLCGACVEELECEGSGVVNADIAGE